MPDAAPPRPAPVLLVDDRPGAFDALAAALADPGLELVRAASAADALRALGGRRFAAVVVAHAPPEADGLAVARRFRAGGAGADTPVVFVTAADPADVHADDAAGLGAVAFLRAPVRPAVARAKVRVLADLYRQTERVRELERREAGRLAEERFRALTEHSIDAVTLVRPDGTLAYASPASRRVLGFAPDEVVGRNGFDLVHPDDRRATRGRFADLMAAPGGSVTVEVRAAHADGSWRWVECVGTNLLDHPAVRAVVVNFRDVTARKRADEERDRFARVGADMLVIAGFDDRFRWVSPSWERVLGWTPDELTGRSWVAFIHPDDVAPTRAEAGRVYAGGPAARFENRYRHKDGGYRWIAWKSVVFPDEGVVYAGASDITERKAAEEALREADRRKDEFLATLAHELRNPLAPIRNAVFVLQQFGGGDAVAAEAVGLLDRQVGQMVRLVDDLLDLSRVSRGKVRLRAERCDLRRPVEHAVESVAPAAAAAGHRLTVALPDAPLTATADPTRVAQAVANVLTNAVKYTPAGGEVALSAAAEGGEAVVRVRDTGIGIPADLLPRVFDLFSQGDHSLARSQGGLGIGLALVKSLVELHGGTVAAYSDGPGAGSEFVLRFPLDDGGEASDG